MSTKLARRLGSVLVIIGVLLAGQFALGVPSAYATTLRCDEEGYAWGSGGRAMVPSSGYSGGWVTSCSMRAYSYGWNPAVALLQNTLNECYRSRTGSGVLEEDGQFGNGTRSALIRAQRWHGISADGEYGPQTARTLHHFGLVFTPYGNYYSCATIATFRG